MNFDFLAVLTIVTLIFAVILLAHLFLKHTSSTIWLKIHSAARSYFPILAIVLLVRAFLLQPFVVPTGSLEPSIQPVEFILLGMYNYGLRLPITHTKIFNTGEPQHGDIVQFYPPKDRSHQFLIKRLIGVGGDKISYVNKQLIINGTKIPQKFLETTIDNSDPEHPMLVQVYEEDYFGVKHKIFINPNVSPTDFQDKVIPAGEYFMMGDNRDNSDDSRYWGTVPEKDLVGKGLYVLLSWDRSKSAVRWARIGARL